MKRILIFISSATSPDSQVCTKNMFEKMPPNQQGQHPYEQQRPSTEICPRILQGLQNPKLFSKDSPR